MSWDYFALFAIVALLFWGLGAFAAWRGKRPVVVYTLTCLGLAVLDVYKRQTYTNYGKVLTTGYNVSARSGFGRWLSVGGNFTQIDVYKRQHRN